MTISPCISICKTDPTTGYCYGCGRNNDEKKIWKLETTTNEWKKNNLEIIKKRLSGWQLESFNESYEYKINNGMSLFKKNFTKKQKNYMNKITIITIIYSIGIIIGALFLDVWGAETSFIKTMSVFIWTIVFLISLFYLQKKEK